MKPSFCFRFLSLVFSLPNSLFLFLFFFFFYSLSILFLFSFYSLSILFLFSFYSLSLRLSILFLFSFYSLLYSSLPILFLLLLSTSVFYSSLPILFVFSLLLSLDKIEHHCLDNWAIILYNCCKYHGKMHVRGEELTQRPVKDKVKENNYI